MLLFVFLFSFQVQFKVKSPFAVCSSAAIFFQSKPVFTPRNLLFVCTHFFFSFAHTSSCRLHALLLLHASIYIFFYTHRQFFSSSVRYVCLHIGDFLLKLKFFQLFVFFMLLLLFFRTKTYADLIFVVLWFFSIRCDHCRIILS